MPLVTPTYDWRAPHLRFLQNFLARVTAREIDRLMIFMPPRHGKSEMTTIRYPIYRLERNPAQRVVIAAYNQTLADKFSRKARRLARERGLVLDEERTAVEDWQTAAGGGVRAVGVGGGITGQGADLIVIDDPVKSREEADSETYRGRVYDWYTDDLFTRREPQAAMILIQTRWHEDDLAGRILASEDGPNWTVVSLPAEAEEDDPLGRAPGAPLWPARYDREALSGIRQVLGRSYYALYQQRPQPEGGAIFRAEWFDRGQNQPERMHLVIQVWDTAFKEGQENDYSPCTTFGVHSNRIYVMNVWRQRVAFPELVAQMKMQAALYRPGWVVVEDKGSGISALQVLQRETMLPIVGVQPGSRNKVERANLVTGLCAAGRVCIPQTAWGDDLVDELLRFPSGKHDDMVDTFVYGLLKINELTNSLRVEAY